MTTPRWARLRKADERKFYAEMRAWMRRPQKFILGADLEPYVRSTSQPDRPILIPGGTSD